MLKFIWFGEVFKLDILSWLNLIRIVKLVKLVLVYIVVMMCELIY